MERRTSAHTGLMVAWSLGAWDAGLILTTADKMGDPWLYWIAPLLVMSLYGWCGWSLGRLAGVRVPWKIVLLLGGGLLLWLDVRRGISWSQWFFPLGGLLAAAGLARAAFRSPNRLVAGLGLLSLLTPGLVYGELVLRSESAVDLPSPTTSPPAGSPNVVLVTWDTVRADSLPAYGGGGIDTPAFDALAAEGALFEDFQSVAPITGPAHLSILSGLYPPSHGLRSNGERGPDLGEERLPELFSDAGYSTAAFVSGYPVKRRFGFARGFQHFDDRSAAGPSSKLLQLVRFSSAIARKLLPESLHGSFSVPGTVTLARASAWIRTQRRPFFLWVHFFDAHFPYDPPEPFRSAARSRGDEGARPVDPSLEREWLLQRGEIAELDSLLARLRETLEESDPGLAHTAVVLLADHGECFGEGGIRLAHEPSLYPATQHIPALFRLPGEDASARRGVRIAGTANQVEVLPTLCALAGLPSPAWAQGRNLLPVLRNPRSSLSPPLGGGFYMEAYQLGLGSKRLRGWLRNGYKYWRSLQGEERLFRHAEDGREREVEDPERLAAMRKQMEAFLTAIPERHADQRRPTAEDRRALSDLGYVGGDEGD